MQYMNEQITKTFEHLLNLCYKYNLTDRLISSSRKSRILYRINQEKLEKYRSQNNSKYDNETKGKNIIPIIKILSEKQINRKTISTQTTFDNDIDSIHSSVNTSSIISEETDELDISSSLFDINKTTIKNSNLSNTEVDFSNKSSSEISIKTDFNQIQNYKFNDYSSKPQSKNCRVYIQSIVRHMLSDDDTSDKA